MDTVEIQFNFRNIHNFSRIHFTLSDDRQHSSVSFNETTLKEIGIDVAFLMTTKTYKVSKKLLVLIHFNISFKKENLKCPDLKLIISVGSCEHSKLDSSSTV